MTNTDTLYRELTDNAVYEKFGKLTKNLTAYCVAYRGSMIGKVVFVERDAGQEGTRVICFIHVLGHCMIEGEASGGGYDIWSAAFSNACEKFDLEIARQRSVITHVEAFINSARYDNMHWDGALRKHSHDVMQVV